MIISHHGQYEFGSPKLPMFPEALMLHYLDDLDSKMEAMRAQFQRESELEGPWTSYNASLGRPLFDSAKFLQGEKAAAAKTSVEETGAQPASQRSARWQRRRSTYSPDRKRKADGRCWNATDFPIESLFCPWISLNSPPSALTATEP